MLPEATALPVQSRKSLLELCVTHRIPLTHACGGMARCSTCRVVVLHGSEHCTARNAIHALNRFYATLGPQLLERGGEINNTMGDGFLAVFPHSDERATCWTTFEAGQALPDHTSDATQADRPKRHRRYR